MSGILDKIQKANDIKKIDASDYDALAQEIRDFIIKSVSETGGHLASNLGVVELTMALHLCMNFPEDKLIWDVGHQAYTHKILTGRKEAFAGLRSYKGMSGFPKQRESACDAFDTGHSSTSISAALGYARARDILGEDYTVAAVIGDGSMTGGMAYEALNNVSEFNGGMIIVLNDNNMSISENVGGFSKYLNNMRTQQSYVDFKDDVETALKRIPGIGERMLKSLKQSKDNIKHRLLPSGFFEDMGINYIGPIDGHDIDQLVRAIMVAKRSKRPIVLHVITKKGKGYEPAEKAPSRFHGVGQFDVSTGNPLGESRAAASYTDVFSTAILRLAKNNPKIAAITAAMPDGTGLTKFARHFPERFFDVGIAEQHAVTFAAGLAAAGMKPYVAVYSSFMQRAYDQIVHDVCIQSLPVVFCIDRAGLVGADGETHQGILDLSYMNTIPNMTVFAPKNKYELYDAIKFSEHFEGPLAIRYPRGTAYEGLKSFRAPIEAGKSELLFEGKDIAIVAVGTMTKTAVLTRDILMNQGYEPTVVNARFIKPLDTQMLKALEGRHRLVVTLEENVLNGGFGQNVASYYASRPGKPPKVLSFGIPDIFVEHGNVDELKKELGLDEASVAKRILDGLKSSKEEIG